MSSNQQVQGQQVQGATGTPARTASSPVTKRIRRIDIGEPFVWLGKGWADLVATPRLSLAYGATFAVMGLIIAVGLRLIGMDYLIYPVSMAFLMVGPFLAFGLYDISRRREARRKIRAFRCLMAGRHNSYHLLTAGLILMLLAIIWSHLAALILALSFPNSGLHLASIVNKVLTTPEGLGFLAGSTVVGIAMSAVTFLFGVVALPMMLDRKVDIFTAALVSFLVVTRNRAALVTWAGLIVIFIGVGLATAYIGLIVTLPLIGHASWHAYRACVDAEAWPAAPED